MPSPKPPDPDLARLLDTVADLVTRGTLAGVASPEVAAFEADLAALTGHAHAVATVSGTQAIALALEARDIGPGDEVVVPALSAFGTLAAVIRRGATPVVADVEPTTGTLSPEAASAARTGATRAVLPLDVMGTLADVEAVRAHLPGVWCLVDAAQGAPLGGPTAPRGDAMALSLSCGKAIDLGEGGAVTTSDAALAHRLRRLVCLGHGGVSLDGLHVDWRAGHTEVGTSARLPALSAALGLHAVATLPKRLARRRRVHEALSKAAGAAGLRAVPAAGPALACLVQGPGAASWPELSLPARRPLMVSPAHEEAACQDAARLPESLPGLARFLADTAAFATDATDRSGLRQTLAGLAQVARSRRAVGKGEAVR